MKTIYNNSDVNYSEFFEEYKEWAEMNDIEHGDEDSNVFHEWVYETLAVYWEDMLANLECDDNNNVDCVVTGVVGRWNGTFDIEPKHFSTLKDAIMACVENCDYIIITEEDGTINVTSIHHDASNSFTIHKLNEKGYEAYQNYEELDNEEFFGEFNIEW